MTTGDLILNASLAVGLFTLILLLSDQFKKGNFEQQAKWLIKLFAVIVTTDFLLLVYYFYTTNLTFDYVWRYTSSDLPLVYKIAGTIAGSQGTLLYWSALIVLGAFWLNEKWGLRSDFMKKTQIVVISLGTYFIGLTMLDSPFKTIYQVNPDLPLDFVPLEGAGLNPLLQDLWMAIHPPIIFIAYAAMTIPFAVAVVYLFKSIKKETKETHREWIKNGVYWCRISWLFLTLAIAIGGFWSYKVLGWGGFWAWDPVETSSLIPWLLLTAAVHALSEHRIKREKYSILAPVLVALTFVLVIYATLVTRSGFFASIHAFGKGAVSSYLVALIALSTVATILLAVIKYLKVEEPEEVVGYSPPLRSKKSENKERLGFVNKTNIVYITILLLVILTIVSFWGVTYPAIRKLFREETFGVFPSWFNIFSYVFFIPLLLMGGLCLNYSVKKKEKLVSDFIFFAGLTIVTMPGWIEDIFNMLFKTSMEWNIVDYTSVVGPEKPYLLVLVGSISILSFIPPSIYIIYSVIDRWNHNTRPLKRGDFKIKELGVLAIHLGIVFILLGAVASTVFSTQYSASLNLENKDQILPIEGSEYGVRLVDYVEFEDYSEVESPTETIPGLSVGEFYDALATGPTINDFTVHGMVAEVQQVPGYTIVRITDGEKQLWVALGKAEVPEGIDLIATGLLMADFPSPSLGKTFDLILLADSAQSYEGPRKELIKSSQQIEVAVYKDTKKIAQGRAKHEVYRGTTIDRVMIDRGITGDIYLIYNGRNGNEIPITVKIVPLINELWFGVILFVAGILAILFSRPTGFAGLEEDIVFKDLCSGCGACAAVCPENAIVVGEFPMLVGECTDCGYCLYQCPRSFFDSGVIEKDIYGQLSKDPLGFAEEKVGVRAKGKENREGSQDGGFVTMLLRYAFEKGLIDGALVTGSTEDWTPVPMLVTSVEELAETMGSKYTNSPNLSPLQEAKEKGLKKLAVVGLACQIEGLRKIQYYPIDYVELMDRVEFTIALFCKGNFLYKGLLEDLINKKYSIDLKKIKKIDIKGKEVLIIVNKKVVKIPLEEANEHEREGCMACSDFTSRLSDFSVGSVGSRKGYTTVLARTKKASDILRRMHKDEVIEMSKKLDESAIERLQTTKEKRAKKVK
ncbi:MAG: Coenzyme F420 hydrogenase/dehydrogenase, beta subunit C-terminal domain [Candidatus Hydrothermarchaeales archaeon]